MRGRGTAEKGFGFRLRSAAASGTFRGVLDVPGDGLDCIAFSPDGRTLATGGSDTAILLWDIRSILRERQPRQGTPSAAELEALWQRLASEKGSDAAQAMARLQNVPQQAVSLLHKRLRPVTPVDARRIGRLLDDLASDEFEVRQRATKELEGLGDLAEPFLQKRLSESPPLEVRRRLEALYWSYSSISGGSLSGWRRKAERPR